LKEESKEDKDSDLATFSKAYALTGVAKIVGIKDYVSYLIASNYQYYYKSQITANF